MRDLLVHLDNEMERWITLAEQKDDQLAKRDTELQAEKLNVNCLTAQLMDEAYRTKVAKVQLKKEREQHHDTLAHKVKIEREARKAQEEWAHKESVLRGLMDTLKAEIVDLKSKQSNGKDKLTNKKSRKLERRSNRDNFKHASSNVTKPDALVELNKTISDDKINIRKLEELVSNQVCDLLEKDHVIADLQDQKVALSNKLEKLRVEFTSQRDNFERQAQDLVSSRKEVDRLKEEKIRDVTDYHRLTREQSSKIELLKAEKKSLTIELETVREKALISENKLEEEARMNLQITEKLYLRQNQEGASFEKNSMEMVTKNQALQVELEASSKEINRLRKEKEAYEADHLKHSTQQKKMVRMLYDQNDALMTEVKAAREGASMFKARLLDEVNNKVDMKRELQAERKRVSELNYEKVRSCFVYPV